MTKSGTSHAFASIVTMVVGAAITEYLKKYFPSIFKVLEDVARYISTFLFNIAHINIPPVYFTPFFVIFILAFIWGILYHLFRYRGKGDK